MAGRFEKGVKWYTHGLIPVHFPENEVMCRYCPALRSDQGGARYKCTVTGEILYNIDLIGAHCPLEGLEEDEHE